VLAHLAAVIAEWAAVIGVLVHVFDRSGTRATGLASIGMLVAALVVAPVTGMLVDRRRPQRVRRAGLVVQAIGYGLAAAAAYTDAPAVVTVLAATVALAAGTTLRPTGAVLMPAHVRNSDELVSGNLWIWYVESFSVLGGPLLATLLLAVAGPAMVLTGCAFATLIAIALTLTDMAIDPPASAGDDVERRHMHQLRDAVRSLRGRPGLVSVFVVVWTQYVMIGALDLVLVVLAKTELDLGDTGPGLLTTAFGLGAFASIVIGSFVTRRARLAPALVSALGAAGIGFVVFGLVLTLPVALIVLPVLGLSRSLLDGPSRLLLQRSARPDALGSIFAIRELCASSGLIVGSVFALAALEVGDAEVTLIAMGIAFLLLLALTIRGLVVADNAADIPVVEMSLLRRLPMFAVVAPITLEAVARSATPVTAEAGEVLVRQGDPGDVFYAVVDGSFDVAMSGRRIRSAERFSFFGEVALLADVPRTATVTASSAGSLLAIDRVAFLIAVTGTDSSRQAAWGVVRSLTLESDLVPGAALTGGMDGPIGAEEGAGDLRR
jgi:MFS family permease